MTKLGNSFIYEVGGRRFILSVHDVCELDSTGTAGISVQVIAATESPAGSAELASNSGTDLRAGDSPAP